MRIGIATWFGTGNFGTDLQSFAFCRYLQKMGHEAYLIQLFHYDKIGRIYTIRRFLGNIKNGIKAWLFGTRAKMLRYSVVRQYKKKYLKIYPLVTTEGGYKRLLEQFDCFISGSDQIWNPYHLSTFYLLDFAANKPRFAYASSVGVVDIPEERKEIYAKHLEKFYAIGIREKSGVEAINKVVKGKSVTQVLDPTFLLEKEEWMSLSNPIDIKGLEKHSYLLVYTIGRRTVYPELIKNVRQKYGIENIVVVNSVEGLRYNFATLELDKVSPFQFIYLLCNARLICTDSFHATALSLNMNLNFINLLRFEDSSELSQNSRIYDLLGHYGVPERIYRGNVFPSEKVDYEPINLILSQDRKIAEDFLFKGLNQNSKCNE